ERPLDGMTLAALGVLRVLRFFAAGSEIDGPTRFGWQPFAVPTTHKVIFLPALLQLTLKRCACVFRRAGDTRSTGSTGCPCCLLSVVLGVSSSPRARISATRMTRSSISSGFFCFDLAGMRHDLRLQFKQCRRDPRI